MMRLTKKTTTLQRSYITEYVTNSMLRQLNDNAVRTTS